MSIEFKKKPRKEGLGLFTLDGDQVFIGKDYALQNEIDETKLRTRARACFRECRTCGACSNSKRDNFVLQVVHHADGRVETKAPTKSYDENTKKWIDCRECEPFRFHDCHNGWFRDSRQEAEPFTPDVIGLLKRSGGKPLI
jgi:hypothetical protein